MVILPIDLGCGTGTISKMVKENYPYAKLHCVDIAKNMIEVAKQKLSDYTDISYENADLADYSFDNSYDVVLSSLTLHHLVTDDEKIHFYTKVYHALNPNGVFYNADNVIGSNETIQKNNINHWKKFMLKNVSEEEITQKWIPKHQDEDHPARLIDQLIWLKNIGFTDVDVIWKFYNFAVYGGIKKGD